MKGRLALPSLVMLAALCALLLRDQGAVACSMSVETLTEATGHPDLPLDRFAAGRLGLLRRTFKDSYLIVAYRHLTGAPLDATERGAMLDLWANRLRVAPNHVYGSAVAPGAPPDALARWDTERARVLGNLAAIPTGFARDYAWLDNCARDAFRVAADTLRDREATRPAAEVKEWARAQELVFGSCSGPGPALPAELPATAPAPARADRDYQIAAAALYTQRYPEAERRFRAIGADPASPWRSMARYLVVRTLTRKALLKDADPKPGLRGALAELEALRADPTMAPMHRALRSYRGLLRARLDPRAALTDTGSALSGGAKGADFAQLVDDYTLLEDKDARWLAQGRDDLTVFLGVIHGAQPWTEALQRYQAKPSPSWLVAALIGADQPKDARLAPLLAAARALPPGSPAYVTARYHLLRLEAGRGLARPALTALVRETRAAIAEGEGRSTRNAFAVFAARHAPSLEAMLAAASMRPAGVSEDDGPVVPQARAAAALPPEITDMMNAGLPLSSWADAATSPTLPEPVRAQIAARAWVRAMLLDDRATAARVAPMVLRLDKPLAPLVQAVERARTGDGRRLALVYALLKAPLLSPNAAPWVAGAVRPSVMDAHDSGLLFCPQTVTAQPVSFLGPKERAAAQRERAAIDRLGAASTWLANEAARLAPLFPRDPRSPEMLHLAVRATRFACTDAQTSAASTQAFRVLHRRFPRSPWTKKTPFHY